MAAQHLMRARGEDGAPLRHLDLDVLREALSNLLRQGDDDTYLIYQLVVEGAEPGQVAVECDVTRAMLVDQLRDAADHLAMDYEHIAFASTVQTEQDRALARVTGKRR